MPSITLNYHQVSDRKIKPKSSLVIDLLKKRGISGSLAKEMFCLYSSEYLIRKNWLLDFHHERGYTIIDDRRWLLACINNDYNESDAFLAWLKDKKEDIIKNGNEDLKRLIEI